MENRKTNDARESHDASVPRRDSYYASAYNDAPAATTVTRAAGRGDDDDDASTHPTTTSPRWGLRGFVPPARFRVAGYAYAHAEESDGSSSSSSRARAMHTIEEGRAIDAREMAYEGEDGEEGDDDDDAMGVARSRREAETRRRVAGEMTSRPSWTGGMMTSAAAC